jgi:CAAX protease family protein
VVSAFALSVILTWVYNSTGGSLLMVVLLHATANLPVSLLRDLLGEGEATLPILLYFGLMVAAAIVVVIVAGPEHLSRKHQKQEEEPWVARQPERVR